VAGIGRAAKAMMEYKQSTLIEIIESEREMALHAEGRYGEFFVNAVAFMGLFTHFIKSMSADRYIFAIFLSQARKHYTLALLSVVRRHHTQAMMDLRQTLEAGACAAYAIANIDPADFADADEHGLLNPSQELTVKRYKWLDDNFKAGSQGIKGMKDAINKSAAHANIVYAHNNFRIAEDWKKFETPFFDIEDEYFVKTHLWQTANIALGLLDLFYGVAQRYGGVVFADDFVLRLKETGAINQKLRAEMMATGRLKIPTALEEEAIRK
jgi:hypothetical protein